MVSRFGLGECPAAVLFSRLNRLNQSPGFSQESIRLGIFVPRRLLNNLLKARENSAYLSQRKCASVPGPAGAAAPVTDQEPEKVAWGAGRTRTES